MKHRIIIDVVEEDFEHTFGRKPRNREEFEDFAHDFENGVFSQIDFGVITDCLKQETRFEVNR